MFFAREMLLITSYYNSFPWFSTHRDHKLSLFPGLDVDVVAAVVSYGVVYLEHVVPIGM